MVVSATRPPEGLGDALLLVDAILDTAKDLKASLNQAKRANTPAALAAASATLGLSRTLAGYARDTHLLLSKSVPAWLPAAPSPRSARASDAKSTARSLRASFASSGVTKRPAKLGVGLAAETAAAADGARREKEKASAAPSTPAAATKPEALEALEAYGTPKAQGTQGTQGIGGAIATGAELEDMVPRDSETSPTPTAKSSAEGARPVSARVERVGASTSAAASRSRARPSTAARPPVPVPAASSSTPRTAMPSPRLERSTAARAAVSESVMVKRAGIGKPSCIIHRRRLGVSADASAREVMDLLRVVQTKLAMGAPVASLVNVATGEELTFAAYAEAKDRAFPSGSSYLALTAAEMHAMRARPWSASPKVPKVPPKAEAPAQTLTARPVSARAAARSRPLAAPSPRRLTPRALEKLEGAAETPGDRKENVPENVPKSPVAKPRVAAPESPPKPASPAAAAKALLAASPPSKAEPMQDLDANVAAPQPVVEKTVQAPQPVVEKIVPAPQPPARPEGVEEGEIVPAEQDLRDVINQSKSKKKKKNKKKK
jgi:hypothetical protein